MNWTKKSLIIGFVFLLSINEFTVGFIDPSPPLGNNTKLVIRLLDLLIIFFALMPNFLIFLGNFYKIFFNFLSLCLLPSLFAIIFLD